MTEEFLHHIWKFRLFDLVGLKTTTGELIEIQRPGDHNFHAGPDFFNARIQIGSNSWAGNVEVHLFASDWKKHHHQNDKAYDNIILHVVYKADTALYRSNGEEIPTVEIKDRIKRKVYQNYLDFRSANGWVACEKQVGSVPSYIIQNTLDKMLLERLEQKSSAVTRSLALNNNNWEETFYQLLARNFGFKTNAEPFELLAKSLPSLCLAKHKSSLLQIEALLFGQAGMLFEHFEDDYPRKLQNEYVFLKQKFKLQPIEKHLWKYLRMRPVNFPDIRIAQFAQLIYSSSHLFSRILELEDINAFKKRMSVSVSAYWEQHFMFDRASAKRSKHLGDEAIDNIIINTVVPVLFAYGKQKKEQAFVEKGMRLLEQTAGEKNAIISNWERIGMPVDAAHATQALIQLKTAYCNSKKCLSCPIGSYVLKNS